MKILFASFDEVPSFKGACTHILAGLRKAVQQQQVVLASLGNFALPNQLGLRHRPIAIREKNYLRRALLFREKISRLLITENPSVIHFRGPIEGLPLVRSGLPCIYEVNAFPSIELRYYYGTLTESILEKIRDWERECLDKAAYILCPSLRLKECILLQSPTLDPRKIIVLPNGYDPVSLKPLVSEASNGPLRGVYLGTLAPWQGILWSLKSFRDIENPPKLDIYSPHQKLQWRQAERRIQRYGLQDIVRLLPPLSRSEISTVLQQYDFALAPLMKTERNTQQGCCPLKIIEYISNGLPTIVSDLFVVKELIKDPNYPFFFQAGSLLSLKASILKVMSESKNLSSYRHYMQNLLAEHLTWSQYGEELEAIYCRLVVQESLSVSV